MKERPKGAFSWPKEQLAEWDKFVLLCAYVCVQANQGGHKADKVFTGLAIPLTLVHKGLESAIVEQKGATVQIALEAAMTVEDHVALMRGLVRVFVKTEGRGKEE